MSNTDPTKNTTQKTKKMSNTDPTKNWGWTCVSCENIIKTLEIIFFPISVIVLHEIESKCNLVMISMINWLSDW
jgi:hypothetical protein